MEPEVFINCERNGRRSTRSYIRNEWKSVSNIIILILSVLLAFTLGLLIEFTIGLVTILSLGVVISIAFILTLLLIIQIIIREYRRL